MAIRSRSVTDRAISVDDMRIRLMIMSYYRMSGVARTVLTQAQALAQRGHDVEVIGIVREDDAPHFALPQGATFRTLVDVRDVKLDEPGRFVPAGEAKSAVFTRDVEAAAIAYIRSVRDGVLVGTRPALNLMIARYGRRGVRRVGQEHMHLAHHQDDVKAAIRQLYPRLDAVVTLTGRDRAQYRRHLGWRTPELVTIPNALHRTELGDRAALDQPVVVATGRLSRQKGFDLLIRAWAAEVALKHPEWTLRIYGSGSQDENLRKLIADRGMVGRIEMMGSTNDIDAALANASMAVVSSRWEGFSLSLVEALAAGLPVVAYDCPHGPRDILTGGGGVLVRAGKVRALGETIADLIDDPARRSELAAAAVARAADYLPDVVMPQWERLYAQPRRPVRRALRRFARLLLRR